MTRSRPSEPTHYYNEIALIANGVEYPVDCIIFPTGFEISSAYQRRMRYQIQGEGLEFN